MNNKKRDCFAALAMTRKRSFAFTLSEVLIVLAVLGVVAAMTIPDLIQDYREKALITALKKNYTVFSQAVDMAIAENGAPNTWDTSSSEKLYNILKPYLRIEKECGFSTGCFANHYEALFNTNCAYQPTYYKGILADGVAFFTAPAGRGSGFIVVDVNGKSGPNKAGVDYFMFTISSSANQLIPMGLESAQSYGCNYNYSSIYNGLGCTYWAIRHENMDYLRKAGNYSGRW